MTIEQIAEGNKIIANFMGLKDVEVMDGIVYHLPNEKSMIYERVKYITSWEWLMPVVKKIRDYLQNIERPSRNHCCKGDMIEVDIQCYLWSIDIEKTWESCVEFINWHNQKK